MSFVDNHNLICVDWNGVLDTYTGYADGKVYHIRPGAKYFLQNLVDEGYRIAIMTSAPVEKVTTWLFDNDLQDLVEFVTNKKVPAILYIDDRAICFRGDFDETLRQIKIFKVHWADESVQANT